MLGAHKRSGYFSKAVLRRAKAIQIRPVYILAVTGIARAIILNRVSEMLRTAVLRQLPHHNRAQRSSGEGFGHTCLKPLKPLKFAYDVCERGLLDLKSLSFG